MSKSLGNFFTIRDVLTRHDGESLRFFFLRSHYRSPLNFSEANVEDARHALRRLYTALDGVELPAEAGPPDWSHPAAARFRAAMDEDFNTPEALAVLFELAGEVNRGRSAEAASLLKALGATLGILQQAPREHLQGGAARPARAGARRRRHRRAHRGARRRQAGARLRRRRRHPRRAGRPRRGPQGHAAGHDLGAGLTMPRPRGAAAAALAAAAAAASAQVAGVAVRVRPAPPYWEDACRHLAKRDRVMRKLIAGAGELFLESRGDAFTTLARSIVGQQISVRAAQAVWNRFTAIAEGGDAPRLVPASVLRLEVDAMRKAGLSARKVEYLGDLARHFESGAVHVGQWQAMDDEAIVDELVAIRGIGRWTAEMFLIFHLLRPNVLPLDDAGLIAGISRNYFSGEPVSRAEAREVAEAWAPYCSVATWYIWRSLDPLPVAY